MRINIVKLYLIFIILSACTKSPEKEKLLVATAANMQYAMIEISKEYERLTGVEVELIVSSSGKLTAQIIQGAPYDLFVSADMKYPTEVSKALTLAKTPEVYGYGQLILWTLNPNIELSLESLNSPNIRAIAVANEETAPYGRAAREVLESNGLYNSINNKLVFGESISQTNQFILSQAADIGFTSLSVVMSPHLKDKGRWLELPQNTYKPIEQGVLLISPSKKASDFYRFLFSESAKNILDDFGYYLAD